MRYLPLLLITGVVLFILAAYAERVIVDPFIAAHQDPPFSQEW